MAVEGELWSVVLLSSISVLVWTYFRWRNHPRYGKNIPVIYPVFGSVLQILANKHRILDWVTENLKSSPTHTIRSVRPEGTVMFMTANPVNVEHILMRRFDNYPKGSFFSDNFEELMGKGIFSADNELWRVQRKVASQEFTTRSLRELVFDTLETETRKRLLPFLDKAAAAAGEESKVIDLQSMFMRLSFDTVCFIAFGVDPACLEEPTSSAGQQASAGAEFVKAFDAATALSVGRLMTLVPLVWKTKRALNVGSEKKLREAIEVVNDFATSVIRTRRKQLAHSGAGPQHLDLLSRFIRLVESDQHSEQAKELQETWSSSSQGKQQISSTSFADEFLRDIVISFILAGRDTSSVALSWFFWLLSQHPEVEKSIHSEILTVLQARKEDREEEQVLSYDELKQMHYLTAALSESMRLYPPVPVDTKMAKEDDIFPDGTKVCKGARVGYHPYAMGRMESIWGPDCLEYKPSRWLVKGECQPANSFKFPAFQAGPRVCLGKDMAMLQMKFVAAAFIRDFTFTVTPADYQPIYRVALTMPMKDGLPVTVRRRSTASPSPS